jgi:chromosomal replication initiation ATPase DnaA|tara:strand:+ start:1610 stop:1918 length:309 start_codon:yes stop_codon:yes gene_type:complete
MNDHIFQGYIDNITQYYGISQKYLFSKGKTKSRVEPRQLFYYLCNKQGIPIVSIQSFLKKKNISFQHHSVISRGLGVISDKIEKYDRYKKIIERLGKVSQNV